MGRMERTGPKPDKSKYQLKLDARKAEWAVTGTVEALKTKNFFFMRTTDGERVFVATELLPEGIRPSVQDRLSCRVFQNEHGLRAAEVLEYHPCS